MISAIICARYWDAGWERPRADYESLKTLYHAATLNAQEYTPKVEKTDAELWWEIADEYVLSLRAVLTRWLMIAGAALLTLIAALYAYKTLRYSMRRAVYAYRGIGYEAMRPGSSFSQGAKAPACQVEVSDLGMFADTFQGYGLRVGDWLVVPKHVVDHIYNKVIIKGPTGQMIVDSGRTRSRIHNDVVYYPISEQAWSKLGVAAAKMPARGRWPSHMPIVSCTGKQGTSSGNLRKADEPGVVYYTGSTINGMSGAAYYASNTVLGMHTGYAGDDNMGVSLALVQAEICCMARGESPTGVDLKGAIPRNVSNRTWGYEELTRQIEDHWTRSDWVDDVDIDYNARLTFDEAAEQPETAEAKVTGVLRCFEKLTQVEKENALRMLDSYTRECRTIAGQSGDGAMAQLPESMVTMRLDRLDRKARAAEERFEVQDMRIGALEERLARFPSMKPKEKKIAAPQASPKPYPCGFPDCIKAFDTKIGVMAHKIAKAHVVEGEAAGAKKKFEGETAFGGDVQKTVKTDKGFRKRPASLKRSSLNLMSTSSEKAGASRSTSLPETQSPTSDLIQKLVRNFSEQLLATLGQHSDTTQSSTVFDTTH